MVVLTEGLVFGETRRHVLGWLYGHRTSDSPCANLCAKRVPQGAVQCELQSLARAGLVTRIVKVPSP